MYLQEILEVAVGLVFMWLVISLAAMQFQEWIANLLNWRSNDLKTAIRKLLSDNTLTEQFYDHQIVRSLSKQMNWWERFSAWFGNLFRRVFKRPLILDNIPSYIPANDFAMVVFDLVMKAGEDQKPIDEVFNILIADINQPGLLKLSAEQKHDASEELKSIRRVARNVALSDLSEAMVDSVKAELDRFSATYPELKEKVDHAVWNVINEYYRKILQLPSGDPGGTPPREQTLRKLRVGILALETTNPKLSESLRTLITGTEEYIFEKERALAYARKQVETWFNNSMDRLSGWYKRKAQLTSFLIGLALALLLNVDSIQLASSLWREPTLRQALVQNADQFILDTRELTTDPAQPGEIVTALQAELDALNIPFGWDLEPIEAAPTGERGELLCALIPGEDQVWGIPEQDSDGKVIACQSFVNLPQGIGGWLGKIAGILMTSAAAAQGAPFWFDVLKRLINVRSSGANPNEKKASG